MVDEQGSKQTKILILGGGAVLGGILGYFVGGVFLGSAIGMGIAVVAGNKFIDND